MSRPPVLREAPAGLIPLRPLRVRDYATGVVRSVRAQPAIVLGAPLLYTALPVPLAFVAACVLLPLTLVAAFVPALSFVLVPALLLALAGVAWGVLSLTLTGHAVTAAAIADEVAGRPASWRTAHDRVAGRSRAVSRIALKHTVSWILPGLVVAVLGLLVLGGMSVVAAVADLDDSPPPGTTWGGPGTATASASPVIDALALGGLAVLALAAAYLTARWSLAPAVAALEIEPTTGAAPTGTSAASRSWALTGGHGWRLVLVRLPATLCLVAPALAWAVAGALTRSEVAARASTSASSTPAEAWTGLALTLGFVGSVAYVALAGPLDALAYLDLRMRKENLGPQLAAAAARRHGTLLRPTMHDHHPSARPSTGTALATGGGADRDMLVP